MHAFGAKKAEVEKHRAEHYQTVFSLITTSPSLQIVASIQEFFEVDKKIFIEERKIEPPSHALVYLCVHSGEEISDGFGRTSSVKATFCGIMKTVNTLHMSGGNPIVRNISEPVCTPSRSCNLQPRCFSLVARRILVLFQ